jgi:hypothetical protein
MAGKTEPTIDAVMKGGWSSNLTGTQGITSTGMS